MTNLTRRHNNRGPATAPNAYPLVKQAIEIAERQRVCFRRSAMQAGLAESTPTTWAHKGQCPTLGNFDAWLQTFGKKLAIVDAED